MVQADNRKTPRSPLRILVVEDSEFLRQVFLAAFRNEHLIEVAAGAREGWEAYLRCDPNIVFLDIILPDGNGHDLAYKIKERSPETYVVMATANDFSDDRQEAAFNHVDGFIAKPFDKQKIDEVIDAYGAARLKRQAALGK